MDILARPIEFWTSIGWMILIGTLSQALFNIFERKVMKSEALSTLQCLILLFASTTALFVLVYVWLWGFTMPALLPGFWRAVWASAIINVGIYWAHVKAASIDEGEVSLTAPLQAMTPGINTLAALTLGELPSKLGILGILTMASGSWMLMFKKTLSGVYEYLGPLRELRLLMKFGKEEKPELKGKALVVRISVLCACLGALGLLMDGLFVRRGGNLQGLILGAMTLTAILLIAYCAWYLISPDATPAQKANALPYFFTCVGVLLFLGMSIMTIVEYFFTYPAFDNTYVAYVGSLKRFHILISVILGRVFFGESEFKKRFFAACLILIGAILISTDQIPANLSSKIESLGF